MLRQSPTLVQAARTHGSFCAESVFDRSRPVARIHARGADAACNGAAVVVQKHEECRRICRANTDDLSQKKDQKDIDYSFVYVASGEPHKNHRRLIDAWCLLAEEGLFLSLCLTLDEIRFPELCRLIDEMRYQYGVKVTNAGGLPHHDVLELYNKSMASIYPSTFESFGLPLIEARQAGLPVLASELDYVRDVLDPEQTFDPESAVSIARAVKRFLGLQEEPLPLQDAARFIEHLLE